MKFKKIIAILCALLLVAQLAACGGSGGGGATTTGAAAAETAAATTAAAAATTAAAAAETTASAASGGVGEGGRQAPPEGKDTNNGRPYNLSKVAYDNRQDKYLNGINATILPIVEEPITIRIRMPFSSTVTTDVNDTECGLIKDFGASDGIFGHIATMFGMTPVNILGDEKYFRTVYVTSEIWQYIGWNSILFMSALTTINPELFEAARIDGASRIKQIWHVSLPGILPTIAILLVLRIGSLMSVSFEKIILLYNPVIYETSDVISSFVYRKGIIDADFGYATAVGLFNSVANFILVVIANKASASMTETSLW